MRAVDRRAREVCRQQVRRELDAHEFRVHRPGQRADRQGLRQPRHALDEHVSPAQHGDEQPFDQSLLADDHLRYFALDAIDEAAVFSHPFVDGGDIEGQGFASRESRLRSEV